MNSAYIVSAVRTPIGKFGGALAEFTAPDMGVIAVRDALRRAFGEVPVERVPVDKPDWSKIPRFSQDGAGTRGTGYHVDEVIAGNARPAGVGPNVARQIAWRSGLGDGVPAFTVNMACASGLRAVLLGWQQIVLGEANVIVAAGTESMSRVPYLADTRWGFKLGHQPLIDGMYRDGLFCQISRMIMGETAEVLARQYSISRDEQDAYALESQRRAARAMKECRFKDELVPVERVDAKGRATRIEMDEHVRPDTTPETLGKLPPVFAKDGTITAGNSSGITDGASAVVLVSEAVLRERKLTPLARIAGAAITAVDPRIMGIAPVPAVRKLERTTGWKLADYDAVELNEAFAAQVLACDRELHLDRARLNPNGGSIALGHPIGCTGARITTTLVHELRRSAKQPGGSRRGLATLCVSGGLGVAMALESC